ncbi:MAG: 2-amino-4-hydroxy-6-hydroxymethyldihydropteridine diphosphokinase [Bacteroidales bacterium]
MNTAYLLLGSNMGDRMQILDKTIKLIHASCGKLVKKSSLFESAPWGFEDNTRFINQVILIETAMSAEDLLQNLLNIELLLGRVRNNSAGYSSRNIDIDILFFNDEIINELKLKVPHPLLQERKFTLMPLNEIASDLLHPFYNKTISELLNECNDPLDVVKFEE